MQNDSTVLVQIHSIQPLLHYNQINNSVLTMPDGNGFGGMTKHIYSCQGEGGQFFTSEWACNHNRDLGWNVTWAVTNRVPDDEGVHHRLQLHWPLPPTLMYDPLVGRRVVLLQL